MRTSPLGMRRRPRRAPLLLSILALVLALAACSDGGGDETSPTTTSPATTAPDDGGDGAEDGESTTTAPPDDEDPTGSDTGGTTEAGEVPPPTDGTEVALDAAQAEAVIGQLLERLQGVLAEAKADGDNAETMRAGFTEVFDATSAQEQYDSINGAGGLTAVLPQPGAPTVAAVEVVGGDGACVTGTAEIDLSPLMARPFEVRQPYSFRLQPAGAGAPSPPWRLSYMGFVRDGTYTENAACPA